MPTATELAVDGVLSSLLPVPVIATNPTDFSVVGLPTWLWLASPWSAVSTSLVVGGLPVVASATPTQVDWDTGDGTGGVICKGPGTPYDEAVPPEQQSTSCSYTYASSSAGRPSADGDPNDAAFLLKATEEWDVTWNSATGVGHGVLPLDVSGAKLVRVEQVESIGVQP